LILERLRAVFPNALYIAEESDPGSGEYPDMNEQMTWYIDPIDGQ
jgi:3'-phosphoadenosine 5'-phosphosulfate (PAPS) 3'-phosphatase